MTLWEILQEALRDVQMARELAHQEAMDCIDQFDFDNYNRLRVTQNNFSKCVFTIIDMLY